MMRHLQVVTGKATTCQHTPCPLFNPNNFVGVPMPPWIQSVREANHFASAHRMGCLLDLKLAYAILWFAFAAGENVFSLEAWVDALEGVGLSLNSDKAEVLTNEAQPPQKLITPTGLSI